MDLNKAREDIEKVKNYLLQIKEITSNVFMKNGELNYEGSSQMEVELPEKNKQLHEFWREIQKTAPPGFSIDSNLFRHLSFNQACDWHDIARIDIDIMITEINEYKKRLTLIEYLESLHSEIRRVSLIILNGDIDAALKTVFASLESKARDFTKTESGQSTVPQIGRAFKEGTLISPNNSHNDAARDFLQGVIGYYRSNIIHNKLPTHRNSVNASLSLFCIAHEAFLLLDACKKQEF